MEPLHPTANPPKIDSFRELPLDEHIQAAIAAMGIVKPTPIQALAIEPVLRGRDVIAKAETGTGKTLAFGAPMMSRIDAQRASVLGLVLTPTRELAEQVAVVLEKLGEPRGLKVALIVGGEPAGPQVAALQAGAQVVVGTPGRVIDLYEQKFLSFPWTEFVVLDEADEMLEIGFIDDVKKILRFTPEERQTLLFSATFPDQLLRLAREHTKDPVEVATASGVKTVDNISQSYIVVSEDDRPLTLIRLLEQSEPDDCFLVFCERRTEVERLMRRLERLPYSIKALHGGYDQAARFRVMGAFREGEVKALVATDVASRGLDVNHVTHVVNYSVPRSITDYTHRIGRTGRAGREGAAVTLVTHEQMRRWKQLQRDATWEIEEVSAPERAPRRPRRDERDERPRRDDRREREERPRREERGEREERPRRERDERPRRDDREERPRRESRARREERDD
ncbi:MAG: DEAD/DEAH box helicase, partial [Planctomycetes bacterium]|nr:DEAD/DEAH box helicase [Planctomycetota bacterium]